MDDISRKYLAGGRLFLIVNAWPTNPLNTITINHITGFPDPNGGVLTLGDKSPNPQMYGFVFTNSIVTTGRYPVWSSGGGTASCAYANVPLTSISSCFSSYTFTNNALIGSPARYPSSSWPAANLFAPDPNDVGFIRCDDGNGGDYELRASSPYKGMATDGKDLGADIVGLKQALAGVE
jgi:hypothetical protein